MKVCSILEQNVSILVIENLQNRFQFLEFRLEFVFFCRPNYKACALLEIVSSATPRGKFDFSKNPQILQVEVDLKDVQAKLGGSTLAFVKKAEKKNAARAAKHVKYRKKDWMIGLGCIGIAGIHTIKLFVSIYAHGEKVPWR